MGNTKKTCVLFDFNPFSAHYYSSWFKLYRALNIPII